MSGFVTSYNNTTGALTCNIVSTVGSGSQTGWIVKAFGIRQTTAGPSAKPVWTQLVFCH